MFRIYAIIAIGFVAVAVFDGCGNSDDVRFVTKAKVLRDTMPKLPEAWPDLDSLPTVNFIKIVLATSEDVAEFRRKFAKSEAAADNYRAITTINRKDIQYFRKGDTVMMPDTIVKDLRAYSVFPRIYQGAYNIPKLIILSNPFQSYACYDSGRLVRFAAVNTGSERKPTFPGRYALNWRQRLRRSSLDSSWMLPFTWNFHLNAGSAFHQFDMPGRPVSHSCARQFMADAEWLFRWGKGAAKDTNGQMVAMTGTPVIILGMFDYTRKYGGPWREVYTNNPVIDLPAEPMAVEEALIPISQIPKDARGSLRPYKRYLTAEDTLRARGIIRDGVRLSESINYNKLRRQKRLAEQRAKQQKAESDSASQ
ncbi:hypothetical protein MASR2M18_01870 [Ignavibacteria bacterium]|nr:L,D-transpeptidase [Bacteroidota bacterium]MCZ2132575.1 L,D-transpeptidase [Bacteroidota bacterium]